jgi:hypothetical protein
MIPFEDIRKVMIEGIAAHLAIPVIEMNGMGKVPPYPFMTYDFNDSIGESVGHPSTIVEYDTIHFVETVTFSVTFQSYAKDKAGAVAQAHRARDWFRTAGHRLLKEAVNVVVTNVGHVNNRDIQIGDVWEHREGFDVDFHTTNTITEALDSIDTISIGRS